MSTAKIKAIVLYCEQLSLIRSYTFEQLGHLLSALIRNADGEDAQAIESSLQEPVLTAYRFIALQINIDKEKYQQTCERRRAAANKRWAKNDDDANAFFAMHNKNKNKNENKNKNKNKNNNKNENKNNSSIAAVGISEPVANAEEAAAADSFYEKAEKEWMPWFNRLLDGYESQIPRLRMMTKPRAERLRELLEKYGRDVVAETFRKAAGSQFLNGRGTKNKFIAKFDWIIDEKHFLDILEGNFNG